MPSYTFVSSANAFALRGAEIVFVDINPDTMNMDPACVRAAITARTKAIVPVHYAGVGCKMDEIVSIAHSEGIRVVEDAAQGIMSRYKGRQLGTIGDLGCISFHETKNIHCGEGGALVINDRALVARAEIIREKGTDRSRFLRGLVDKYTWVDVGSSYLPSDMLAAYLLAQFEVRDQIQAKRRQIWEYYHQHLQTWAARGGIRFPVVPGECEQAYHMFYILMPSLEKRQALIARGTLSLSSRSTLSSGGS
jgi:dTDP-4-amino-4,6-dideoxygalactose transaminase